MNVRPLRDRILVERLEESEQRIGGIIIPDTAREKPQQAKVVAVGRGRVNDDGDSHWEVMLTGVMESLPVSRRQQFVVRDVGRETAA